MEIKELVTFFVNESAKILEVTFRLTSDGEDEIRNDQIDLNELDNFGYDFKMFLIDEIYEDDENINEESLDSENFINVDELISFLNEYYLIYSDRLPNAEFY